MDWTLVMTMAFISLVSAFFSYTIYKQDARKPTFEHPIVVEYRRILQTLANKVADHYAYNPEEADYNIVTDGIKQARQLVVAIESQRPNYWDLTDSRLHYKLETVNILIGLLDEIKDYFSLHPSDDARTVKKFIRIAMYEVLCH